MSDEVACPHCGCLLDGLVPAGDVELWKSETTKLLRQLKAIQREDMANIERDRRLPEARKVWDHWLATFNKSADRWKFGKSRKEGVLKTLGDYSVDELCEAISGAKLSVWHVENGRIDIETILRSAKTIDNHRARLHAKQSKESD